MFMVIFLWSFVLFMRSIVSSLRLDYYLGLSFLNCYGQVNYLLFEVKLILYSLKKTKREYFIAYLVST